MENNKKVFDFNETDKRVLNFHNFKLNPEVMGILKGFTDGDFGQQIILEYDNKTITIGSYTALKDKLKVDDIGKAVKIVCNGMKKNALGKREYMDFEVFVKEVK